MRDDSRLLTWSEGGKKQMREVKENIEGRLRDILVDVMEAMVAMWKPGQSPGQLRSIEREVSSVKERVQSLAEALCGASSGGEARRAEVPELGPVLSRVWTATFKTRGPVHSATGMSLPPCTVSGRVRYVEYDAESDDSDDSDDGGASEESGCWQHPGEDWIDWSLDVEVENEVEEMGERGH